MSVLSKFRRTTTHEPPGAVDQHAELDQRIREQLRELTAVEKRDLLTCLENGVRVTVTYGGY